MPLFEQVLETYPAEVKLVFKNFPLRSHKFARKAAMAALAAGRQEKFWAFHDQLFDNATQLNDEKIREIARKLGLDVDQFEEHMKDPTIPEKINEDIRDGGKAGVRGIPTIFINGRFLRNRSFKGFEALIEKELRRVNKGR